MKIAFLSTNMNFCGTILGELRAHHDVRVYDHTSDGTLNMANVMRLLDWCDVAYFDFIQYPLPFVTHLNVIDNPVIARMDGLDIMGHHKVDWNKVSALVLMEVQEPRLKRLRDQYEAATKSKLPPLPDRILKRSVGIDLRLFWVRARAELTYKICFHANVIRDTKRVYTAIQCFNELIKRDDKLWEFTLIGQWEGGWAWPARSEYVMCCRELLEQLGFPSDRFRVMGNLPREEWAKFIQTQDVFWNLSFREGFPNSLGEACASGAYPVINWWAGAELIYPEKYLCRSPSEIVERTIEWGTLNEEEKRVRRTEARRHIERYDAHETARMIRELIEEFN
ncbi:hypothetical protein ES703_19337 [subsurface metagenome]